VDLQLWHGGAPGLSEGDRLLPPTETGLVYTRIEMSLEEGLGKIGQRRDRVYVTTRRALAKAYAGLWTPDGQRHGGGTLYRVDVEPDDLEPDEDVLSVPGLCYQAVCATVVRVYDPHVRYDSKFGREMEKVVNELEAAKALAAHTRESRSDA
jgi:hypothetical protein